MSWSGRRGGRKKGWFWSIGHGQGEDARVRRLVCTSRNWLEHRREKKKRLEGGGRPGVGKRAKVFVPFVGQI